MRYEPHCFEELEPGLAFVAGPRRVTRDDIDRFASLSGDHTQLHTDDAYAARTPFGGVVAHGALNLAVATGLAYDSSVFEGTVLAIAGMEIAFERPVFPGDQLTLRLTVLRLDDRPRPDRGRVSFAMDLSNEAGKTVLSGTWQVVLRRRPQSGPASA